MPPASWWRSAVCTSDGSRERSRRASLSKSGALAVLLGMILNRFDVSWFAVTHSNPIAAIPAFMGQVSYFPSLPEVLISVGIFSAGILAFGLAVKYLPVFEEEDNRRGIVS